MNRVSSPKGISLDVHAHLAPMDADHLPSIAGVEFDGDVLVVDGHRVGLRDLYHPERLVAWMDDKGIERALVSIPPPFYRQRLGAVEAFEWARYANACLLSIARASEGRLQALHHLPMEHPDVALRLLEEVGAEPFVGVALSAGGHGTIDYADPAHDALWAALDARAAFVFLHPGRCCDTRLTAFYLENLVGNPYETGLAAAQLVMAGVPARFPAIEFCLAHAGGTFPAIVGRLEQGFETRRPGLPEDVERPLVAARRFRADSIAHHAAALGLASEIFGEDHILFGSDWPFPMGLRDAPPPPKPASENSQCPCNPVPRRSRSP